MADLDLTYAGIDYLDRTRPLFDGTVKPWGATLRLIPLRPFELFRRVAQYDEFDAAEFSFSTYTNLLARGDDRYIAIPFFPSRYFRHADIYVHRDSGIAMPQDLRGKRVGIAEYQMTAALWQRAFLQYDYGVQATEIQWFTGGLKTPGHLERNAIPDPPGVSIDLIPADRTLEEMVAAGEFAALFSPIRPPALVDGTGRLRRAVPPLPQGRARLLPAHRLLPDHAPGGDPAGAVPAAPLAGGQPAHRVRPGAAARLAAPEPDGSLADRSALADCRDGGHDRAPRPRPLATRLRRELPNPGHDVPVSLRAGPLGAARHPRRAIRPRDLRAAASLLRQSRSATLPGSPCADTSCPDADRRGRSAAVSP